MKELFTLLALGVDIFVFTIVLAMSFVGFKRTSPEPQGGFRLLVILFLLWAAKDFVWGYLFIFGG